MLSFERALERVLWSSRLLIFIAVVASLLISAMLFYVASADVVRLAHDVVAYDGTTITHTAIVAHVAEIVDGYLFAAILVIFALGLYELFISRIEAAESSPIAQRLLLITSIDDLKERLAKVVFLILVVRYFQFALEHDPQTPLDLLELAVGIALIAFALFLTGRHANGRASRAPDRSDD
ncbi:MAG: YqhA family protein [bacterium]|nr:YqhA family protein [bacterium]